MLFARVCQPHCCSWSCETHVSNNEEMAFNYTEVLTLLVQEGHCTRKFEAVWYKNQGKYGYQFCAWPFEELEDGEIGVLAISRMSL